MHTTRPVAFPARLACVFTLCLCGLLPAARSFAQAPNLVIDSLQGEVTQNEVDTYISYMNGGTGGALLPTNALGDNLAYGTPGSTLEGLNYMYRITGDIPSMSTEHMQLLNLAIVWSENFILLRNDQANGPHQVMWTGNVDPVWITYASNTSEAGYAGSENGDTAGHILYTALNILQTPAIWNQPVPDGNPNNFGVTYLQRAQTYINMMEVTTQNYFTKYFINPTTYQIVPPTSPAWTVFAENMDAWNRQFLLTNDYLRLAQCHAILADNPSLQAFYTNIVKASTDAFVANAQLVTGANAEAAYDWGYGNEGDLLGQITGESSSHASYDMQGLARVFEAGAPYTSAALENLERYGNTIEYVLFNFAAYNANQTTAYYKTIDAGLPPVPSGTATQDYLYPQFYFLTPYNTLFWGPAAYGAGVHNNYHNNPYMTAGILYSKHWVYNHPQTSVAVAANSQTVAAGGTATYNITTNSTGPVTLSVTGLPAGATASFSHATVPAGAGASTLTVTAPSNSINGSVLFTLNGSSGSSLQTVPLSLVTTAPDFVISLSSTSTVSAGSPGSFTVTIKPSNGFTGNVTLSSDNNLFPAGTAATYTPAVITGGSGTSSVSVATSATTTPGGEWSIGITGTSGNIQHEGYSRLTVKNVAQTITFPTIPNVVYGAAPISLQATAGSNLPVTYTVTGPAVVTGTPTLLGQQLAITGAGTVTVTAKQSGNTYYTAAPAVVQTFNVSPAVLTVTAQNLSMAYGAPVPTLLSTTTGFINGDTPSVVTGAPALTTTATSASPVGAYTITAAQGTLTAANYTFVFANGVLDIYGGRR
jgi:hypothetical protein